MTETVPIPPPMPTKSGQLEIQATPKPPKRRILKETALPIPPPQALAKVEQQDSIQGLITLAIEKNIDIDKLERLLQMKERNDKEVSRRLFIEAMSAFQGECPPLTKDKKVNFEHRDGGGKTEYWYHQLPAIEKHIKPLLSKHGLNYRWAQKDEGNKLSIWLIISHVGGHEEVGEPLSAEPDNSGKKNAIQQKGSAIQYLRRYTLLNGFGLSSGDKDDDGKSTGEGSDLPRLKDEQILSTIQKLHKGETTWESIDAKCTMTPLQRETIEKGLAKLKEGKS